MFPITRRSAISDLQSDDPERRAKSLETIAAAYWKPVYKYVRLRWRLTPEQAEDLTQSFFETALLRDMWASYRPEQARFRTFLRACLDRHAIDQHRRATAARRGGGRIALDFSDAENELVDTLEGVDVETVFDAEWLRHLMQLAMQRFDQLMAERGKPVHAALFREFHVGDNPPSYAEAAARHKISVNDVTNWLHVARREFRQTALEMLREVTIDDADFAAEARAVFGIDVAESTK